MCVIALIGKHSSYEKYTVVILRDKSWLVAQLASKKLSSKIWIDRDRKMEFKRNWKAIR